MKKHDKNNNIKPEEPILEKAIHLLEKLFKDHNIDSSHGINHALAVLNHANKAVSLTLLDNSIKEDILLAALLHDADDKKYFGPGYTNAKSILKELNKNPELIIKMISLVSCSENGDSIVKNEYELYPRYADRLESIGKIGILRCYLYNKHLALSGKYRPLFTTETPRAKNLKQVYEIATLERYNNYINKKGNVGTSSFIDHFYDKLLHFKDFGTNPYFCDKATKKLKIIQDFVIDFGITGTVNEEMIEKLRIKYGY